jgi:hypothetical protein
VGVSEVTRLVEALQRLEVRINSVLLVVMANPSVHHIIKVVLRYHDTLALKHKSATVV